jgi:hypothetical protein
VNRWAWSASRLIGETQKFGERLVELAKTPSTELFAASDDLLESVVFSTLVVILKRQDKLEEYMQKDSDD